MLKNDLIRYRSFLFFELLIVLLIMGIFKLIPDRPTAGLVAGSVFFVSTLLVIGLEWKFVRKWTWALSGGVVFFVFAVLPILVMRYLSWGIPFEEARLFGISGGIWHRASNYLYLLMLAGIFISLQKTRMMTSPKKKGPR